MPGPLFKSAKAIVDGVVAAESALLERPPRSLEGVDRPIVVATHRRSGTHLTIDTLRRNFPACRPRLLPLENLHKSYLNVDVFETGFPQPIDQREALRILGKADRPTIKTHSEAGYPAIDPAHRPFVDALLENCRTLYIARDGRKVMCSLWTWRRVFDETARVPFPEFIRQQDGTGRSRPRQWADHVLGWLETPGVVSYTFDELVKDSARVLGEIGERFDLAPAWADPLIPPPNRTRLATWTARLRGDATSTNQHAAGDRPPKPADVFGDEDDVFFEREAGDASARLDAGR